MEWCLGPGWQTKEGTIRSPNGIATDGTDIWIVDGAGPVVKRYSGAASRTSGAKTPARRLTLVAGVPQVGSRPTEVRFG